MTATQEEGPPPAGEGPVTPEQPPQAARQLAAELDRTQKGRAAAELHAAQLMGEAQRWVGGWAGGWVGGWESLVLLWEREGGSSALRAC